MIKIENTEVYGWEAAIRKLYYVDLAKKRLEDFGVSV